MNQIEYIGCFFEPEALLQFSETVRKGPLYRSITFPHVTLSYNPKNIPLHLFGEKITVKVISYGCDEINEALLVEFVDLPPELLAITEEIPVPHITLSVAKDGKPVDSRFLEFTPIKPFLLEGIFGGLDMDGNLLIG